MTSNIIKNSLLAFTVAIFTQAEAVKTTLHAGLSIKEPVCYGNAEKVICQIDEKGNNNWSGYMTYCIELGNYNVYPYWYHHSDWNHPRYSSSASYCHKNNLTEDCKCTFW